MNRRISNRWSIH